MITVDDVMARNAPAVRAASAYWLVTANKLLADTDAAAPLTPAARRRWQLIQAEMRARQLPV